MDNDTVKTFIQDLISVMEGSRLSELEVEMEGTRIRLQKESSSPRPELVTVTAPAGTPVAPVGAPAPQSPGVPETPAQCKHIIAPMVGTLYAAGSPEADPYVEVGDIVDEETIVCIIEAMKVMNEIKAETCGKIVEVLVNNGEPVEYGQPLFLVDPSDTS